MQCLHEEDKKIPLEFRASTLDSGLSISFSLFVSSFVSLHISFVFLSFCLWCLLSCSHTFIPNNAKINNAHRHADIIYFNDKKMWEMQVNKVLFDLLYEKKRKENTVQWHCHVWRTAHNIHTYCYFILSPILCSAYSCMRSVLLSNVNSRSNAFWRKENKNCFRIFWNIYCN